MPNSQFATPNSPRILFVHNARTRFVQLDLDILRRHFPVTEMFVERLNPLQWFRTIPALLRHDLVFGWFASWHMLLPLLLARLFRRPSVLIVGGYDLANLPEHDYGLQRGGLARLISRACLRLARTLVAISEFSRAEIERNAKISVRHVSVLHLGVPDPFGRVPEKSAPSLVITVGNVNRANLGRKGHSLFVQAAALVPEAQFVIIGRWQDAAIEQLRAQPLPNLVFTGWLSETDLLDYYRRAHVVVQASAHEGFGLSLAEAMLAGCLPVVSRLGALHEVAGANAFFLDDLNPPSLAAAVRGALSAPASARTQARQQIVDHFPLSHRERGLSDIILAQLNSSQ